jgi:hypothetical protein
MERDSGKSVIVLKRQISQLFYSPYLLHPHLSLITPELYISVAMPLITVQ